MRRIGIHRRVVLGATVLNAVGVSPRAWAVDAAAVVAPIQQLCKGLLAIMHAGQTMPFAQRFSQLAPVVERVFDLATILQISVGPSWPTLSADQRSMLLAAFRRYTIASYVSNFDEYSGQRFDVASDVRGLPNGEQVVDTRIVPTSGDAHTLDYVMRQNAQVWRVVDVLLDGTISRVAVQRSDFRRLLSEGGAAALAKSLDDKTANLSGGAA
ncbi:MAG TPA: ABC transporter substrate-binding protein [Acetobacteraceae bacterium]|nr:ABC transporter substrate-binding protein [Acetobacteraceae bacterium]